MLLAVEVLRPELGEHRDERRMRRDSRERVLLEPLARLEQSGRDAPCRWRSASRSESRLRLLRQIELVRRVADGVLPFGRFFEAREHLSHPDERFLPIVGSLDLEPDAIAQVALRTRKPLFESLRKIGRIEAGRQRDDSDVEALRKRELHPAQRRRLAGGVAVEASQTRFVSRPSSFSCCSVSAVPIDATTGSIPAWLQRDHVGVPFDDERAILLRDRGPRLGRARRADLPCGTARLRAS